MVRVAFHVRMTDCLLRVSSLNLRSLLVFSFLEFLRGKSVKIALEPVLDRFPSFGRPLRGPIRDGLQHSELSRLEAKRLGGRGAQYGDSCYRMDLPGRGSPILWIHRVGVL